MADNNVFTLNMITKEMMYDIDMLRARMLHRIMGYFDSTLIVTEKWDFLDMNTIILQRLFEPHNLCAAGARSNTRPLP